MKLTDYIVSFFEELGQKDVFMLSGGGCMHLVDSFGSSEKIRYWCLHHEQAVAMATEAYGRMTNQLGLAVVTCGPGATNTVTGVLGAWQDSVPCVFLAGQVKRCNALHSCGIEGLRQFGQQDADLIPIVSSITKYAVMVDEPQDIRYHLQKAVYLAKHGRPGPVWLDIPLDVQNAQVDEKSMRSFMPEEEPKCDISEDVAWVKQLLTESKRPVIVAGRGVTIADTKPEFKQFVEKYNIPMVNSFLGVDILASDHKCNIGRIGIKGTRAGNFTMQNADLIISIGSRLSVSSIGFQPENFAREAKVVIVDIDPIEHKKKMVEYDKLIVCDAKDFINDLSVACDGINKNFADWLNQANHWKKIFADKDNQFYKSSDDEINYYEFIRALSAHLQSNNPVISDAGSAFYVTSQAIQLRDGERYIPSGALATMGYTLPATIGVAVADLNNVVVGVTGDGSFMQNMQELAIMQGQNLPIKLFVVNNNGYLSIRQTQRKFFKDNFVAEGPKSGVFFPELRKVADAFELPYYCIKNVQEAEEILPKVFADNKPMIIEVVSVPLQEITPTVQSLLRNGQMYSKPLEDMYPFMDRNEFEKEMIVKPIDEQ